MKDIRTAVIETKHDWPFTRINADEDTTETGESFLVPRLPQREVCHG
jgi:hypothetical protein